MSFSLEGESFHYRESVIQSLEGSLPQPDQITTDLAIPHTGLLLEEVMSKVVQDYELMMDLARGKKHRPINPKRFLDMTVRSWGLRAAYVAQDALVRGVQTEEFMRNDIFTRACHVMPTDAGGGFRVKTLLANRDSAQSYVSTFGVWGTPWEQIFDVHWWSPNYESVAFSQGPIFTGCSFHYADNEGRVLHSTLHIPSISSKLLGRTGDVPFQPLALMKIRRVQYVPDHAYFRRMSWGVGTLRKMFGWSREYAISNIGDLVVAGNN